MFILKMEIVIESHELKTLVNNRYPNANIIDIKELLFGNDYVNNYYKRFYIDSNDEPLNYNEEKIYQIECVKKYLRFLCPNYTSILIGC